MIQIGYDFRVDWIAEIAGIFFKSKSSLFVELTNLYWS